MELKNNFSLTKEEASDLLFHVANSLKNRGKFEMTFPNQAISLDIGEELTATLTASDTRFTLDFMWKGVMGEEEVADWRNKFDKDMAEAGLPIGDAEGIPVPVAATSKSSGPSTTKAITATINELQAQGLGERRLTERMIVETTTLPYDGGVWNPAFNLTYATHWTEIGIDNQLENTKWISEEELEALAGATRTPRRELGSSETDDDLFDDLDASTTQKVSTKRPQGGIRRKTGRQIVTPAAMIHHSSTMDTDMDEASIKQAAETWTEPEKEATDDEWVKPSEVIAKKGKPQLDTSIPTPTTSNIAKQNLTPPPVTTAGSGKLDSEILDWEAPASSETGDDWVKPSEILKQKNKKPQNTIPPVPQKKAAQKKKARPPPVAPDKPPLPKKGKKEKDDDKKGWASWDK
ncbi:MAG: hypothetical protein GPJ54_05440 [Candidatus Heimdallarchaeota archaeon]|nr:hypothetical protein [Candidatus Heimdallarchaeota archaeon]